MQKAWTILNKMPAAKSRRTHHSVFSNPITDMGQTTLMFAAVFIFEFCVKTYAHSIYLLS